MPRIFMVVMAILRAAAIGAATAGTTHAAARIAGKT